LVCHPHHDSATARWVAPRIAYGARRAEGKKSVSSRPSHTRARSAAWQLLTTRRPPASEMAASANGDPRGGPLCGNGQKIYIGDPSRRRSFLDNRPVTDPKGKRASECVVVMGVDATLPGHHTQLSVYAQRQSSRAENDDSKQMTSATRTSFLRTTVGSRGLPVGGARTKAKVASTPPGG